MRPPHDLDAELATIGAMLRTRPDREAILAVGLTSSDFYSPGNARIFAGIVAVHVEGAPPDAALVAARMPAYPDGSRPADDAAAVREAIGAAPLVENGVRLARIVADHAAARRAQVLAGDVMVAAADSDLDAIDALLADARERVARPTSDTAEAPDLAELLARPDPIDRPWVVKGLLREGDRLVLTGGEGHGKMTLLRQLAVRTACGFHPLTGMPHARKRALIIDLQEDEHDLRRELGFLAKGYQSGWLFAAARPQGMNLLSAADARWVEALIVRHQPHFVVCGPLYKTYRATEQRSSWAEETVEHVTRIWDELRTAHGFALAIEGHAGHDRETWRVRGSSAWYAWPDFGYGLAPQENDVRREVQVKSWRGDRHPGRPWPRRLFGGVDPAYPWVPDEPTRDRLLAVADPIDQPPLDGEVY